MPRNIVICCDGTNNEFGRRNTNVVRLIQTLGRNPRKQHLYYDPGLGTLPEPGAWSSLGKKISMLFGLAFGAGLAWKVGEAYSYLMDFWEPGDRVFIFGFSRGAYTARVLAGLLYQIGLLPRGNQNLIPYVLRLYKGVRGAGVDSRYGKLCAEFRQTFPRQLPGADDRRLSVHSWAEKQHESSTPFWWLAEFLPKLAGNPGRSLRLPYINLGRHRVINEVALIHGK